MLQVLLFSRCALGYNNGAPYSRLPPMGWSSWDALAAGSDHPVRDFCDEISVKAAADAYIEAGLFDAGYRHLHLDDCWAAKERDSTGHIQADPERFPHGMKTVADYVHSKGLVFGLYTSAGRTVCVGGRVGSQGHWQQDAATFAKWGIDWVKMDWCGGASDVRGSYAAMSKALNESGRHIALNMCRGDLRPWDWIDQYAQSWRVTEDHSGKWSQPSHGIKQGIASAMHIPREATGKPYAWNDLDMLQTGTGPASGFENLPVTHLHTCAFFFAPMTVIPVRTTCPSFDPTLGAPNVTLDESITEFSMWAILASPLLFTTPIMNCTSPSPSPPSPSNGTCACTKRVSKAECIQGKTFGCLPNGSMWAIGCRGIFTCDGVDGVSCNVQMPDPPRNHTCTCQPPGGGGHNSPPMSPKNCTAYLNPTQRKVLLNKEVIAINQDVTPQGFPTVSGDSTVWARNLSDGSVAVALYNEEDAPRSIGTPFTALGWTASTTARVRDLWAHTENGTATGMLQNVTVRPHATVVVRLYPIGS